jgi:hypothetical protein
MPGRPFFFAHKLFFGDSPKLKSPISRFHAHYIDSAYTNGVILRRGGLGLRISTLEILHSVDVEILKLMKLASG